MTLEEFVLTYKKEDGTPLVTIAEYYERYIKPLDERFAKCSFYSSKLVLCCFKDHNDINPSLGTVNHKYLKGVRIYHCFGCGASGTVIRLHQRIQKEYYNRTLSETESALELCSLFGIDASKYSTLNYEGDQSGFVSRMNRLSNLANVYTIKEFSNDLLSVRQNTALSVEERANKVNSALVKYIATSKKLYNY